MALQIQGRPTEFCLKNCPNMELDVDSQTMYADGEPYHIETKVSCRYEKICKMWHDQQGILSTASDSSMIGRGKRATWQVLINEGINYFDTSYIAKCSCCGHIHRFSNPVEHLPSECPDCHSIMDAQEVKR